MEPVLGIGIITRNRLAALKRCVAEVKRHTVGPYALMIADDGSEDETVAWARDQGILVVTGARRGVAWNKNRALVYFLQHTTCDPILLLEDDTWPNRTAWDNVWVPVTRRWSHVNLDGATYTWDVRCWPEQPSSPNDPLVSRYFTGCCTATTRAALQEVGFLNSRFHGYGLEHVEWTSRFRRVFADRWSMPNGALPTLEYGVLMASTGPTAFIQGEVEYNRKIYLELIDPTRAPEYCPPWQDNDERRILEAEIAEGKRRYTTARAPVLSSDIGLTTSLRDLMSAYSSLAEARLATPNGPHLVIYTNGDNALRVVSSICSMIVNGYVPLDVWLFGEHRWNPEMRESAARYLPFAKVVPTSQLIECAREAAGDRFVDLVTQSDQVLRAVATLLFSPSVLDICLLKDNLLIIDGIDDAVHASRTHDLVFAPGPDHGVEYKRTWPLIRPGIQPFEAVRNFKSDLYFLRRGLNPHLVAEYLLHAEPATYANPFWFEGLLAMLYGGSSQLELGSERYSPALVESNETAHGALAICPESDCETPTTVRRLLEAAQVSHEPTPPPAVSDEDQIDLASPAVRGDQAKDDYCEPEPGSAATSPVKVTIRGRHFWAWPTPYYRDYWGKVNAGQWEPETFALLDQMLGPQTPYVDGGAWIGPTVLFAASKGAYVAAFECDPISLGALKANLALNPQLSEHVEVYPLALSNHDGPIELYAHRFGDSMSTVLDVSEGGDLWGNPPHQTIMGVDILRLESWFKCPEALIKLDIEGGEYLVLEALRDRLADASCSFFISFHAFNLLDKSRPNGLIALRKNLDWMDSLWDYNWWIASSVGMLSIEKDRLLEDALGGKPLPALLFTRRPTLDGLQD